jgi:mercuric ion transport protein
MMTRILGLAGTAVATAFGSAVCCAGPTVAASIGVSAAGLSLLTPYRPLFILAAAGALWVGFERLDRDAQACDAGKPCAAPAARKRMQRIMGGAFVLVLLFGTAPAWIGWLL